MEKKFSANVSVVIDAPRSKVWNALVNPELIRQYLHGTEAVSEWKVGSPLIFKGVWKNKPYLDKGEILEIENEKLLRYTWLSSMSGLEDIPQNYAIITYRLSDGQPGIKLTLTQDNITSEEARKNSVGNWTAVLSNLKKIVEAK